MIAHRARRRRSRGGDGHRSGRPGPFEWAAAGLLSALVVVLPAWRGAVSPWVVFGGAALAVVAALATAPAAGALGLAGLALLAALLLTGLQLVPWPAALHALSPAARDLFETSLGPLGLYPAARPLSLDPAATGLALATGAGGLAAFLAAWALGATGQRRALVVKAVGASGLLLAVAVLGRALLGLGPLLAPSAPLVNPNHLAGAAGLGAFVLLGVALEARGQARLLWLLAFTLTGAVPFLSLSRGGISAFLGGCALFVLLAGLRPGHRSRWALLAGLAAALSVASYLALDPVLAELRTLDRARDETKLALWRPAWQLVRAYPLTGVGRGAFETVFPAYKTEPDAVTFTHLENEWLQPFVELGVAGGLLLVGALALTWLAAAWRRDRSWHDVGLLAGAATLAAQNLVDFSLELLGVAVPFMVALGLAARGAGAVRLPRWAVAAAVLLAGGLGALGAWTWLRQPAADAPVAEQVAWRPADWLPPAAEGVRLVQADRCSEALPWLTRSMLLGPTESATHLHAARCLAASGQGVLARREYRLAHLFGAPGVLAEAARRYPEVRLLEEVVPTSGDGLLQLGAFLHPTRPADAAAVYRKALEEAFDERALVPLAHATWAAGDAEGALDLARRRTAGTPGDPEGWRLTAALLAALGRPEEAGAALAQGLERLPGSPPLVAMQVERALAARHFGEARRLAETMSARAPHELVARHHLVARALAGQGRWGEAVEQARSASAVLPDDPGLLLALASYLEQAGRYDDAVAAVEAAASRHPDPASLGPRLEALKAARRAQRDRRMGEALLR